MLCDHKKVYRRRDNMLPSSLLLRPARLLVFVLSSLAFFPGCSTGNFLNSSTVNTTQKSALYQVFLSAGFSSNADHVPAQAIISLWSSDTGTDEDKRAVLLDSYAQATTPAVLDIVNVSVAIRPDLINSLLVDAVTTLPHASVGITKAVALKINKTDASAVLQNVVNAVKDLAPFSSLYTPAAILITAFQENPDLKKGMYEIVKTWAIYESSAVVESSSGEAVTIPGASLSVSPYSTTNNSVISLAKFDCKFLSRSVRTGECFAVTIEKLEKPAVLIFDAAVDTTMCMKSADMLSDNFVGVPCIIAGGKAQYSGTSFSVFTTYRPSGAHTHDTERFHAGKPVTISRDQISYNVIQEGRPVGNRAVGKFPDSSVSISKIEAEILGFDVFHPNQIIYSNGHALYKSSTELEAASPVVSGIANFTIEGANFGVQKEDLLAVRVRGVRCPTLNYISPVLITCISGEVEHVNGAVPFKKREVVVTTTSGNSTLDDGIRNINVRLSEGYSLPFVTGVARGLKTFRPHAVLADTNHEYFYWSDTSEQTVRRSNFKGADIELVSSGNLTRRVLGMALDIPAKKQMYATDANEGTVVIIPTEDMALPIKILLRGLRDPRGIALDTGARELYFTELTGKIYRASMDGLNIETNPNRPVKMKQMLVRRPSKVRLDGISLDLSGPRRYRKIYWAEANSNNIMRSSLDGQKVEVIAGLDSGLMFPQGIGFDTAAKQVYFSEYFGKIYRLSSTDIEIGNEPSRTKVIDASRGAASTVREEMLALTKVGGQFFFSVKD